MLLQVYADNAMKKSAVYKWVTRFSEGRESVTNEESSGRSPKGRTDENISKVRQIVRKNRRLTVISIAEQAIIDRETVRKILTLDLNMMKLCAKWSHRSSPKNTVSEGDFG
jgi:predicted transposase YdaD